MKLKYEFETVELDGEIMAVPVGDNARELHSLLRLNETAADILELLRTETDAEAVTDALLEKYTGEREEITAYVREYLAQLAEMGVVE